MVVVPQSAPSFQPIKALDIITSAMLEINALAAGEVPNPDDGAWGLQKLQRLIDKLNAIRQAIYSVNFTKFTLIPNHNPHTMGIGGDFDTTPAPRPVKIVAASFILNAGQGANEVDSPRLHIRDAEWYAALPTKSLTSSICTDLYYDPATPLGNCNFWPICNIANPVRLETWNNLIVPLAMNTQLYFPQAYWDAIVCRLALELCSSFEKQASPDLVERSREAMNIIMANNAHPPRIRTDGGMPAPGAGASGRPDYNFLTGLRE
jgi:hypothetical protein